MSMSKSFDSPVYAFTSVDAKEEKESFTNTKPRRFYGVWKIFIVIAFVISLVSIALSIVLYMMIRQTPEKQVPPRTENNAAVAHSPSSISPALLPEICEYGFHYQDNCVFAVYPQHLPSRGNAKSVCSAFNSSVAEIVSDDMLHKVVNYIRESWFPKNPNWTQPDLNMWLGSIFHAENNPLKQITLKNGKKIQLSTWYPGFPIANSSFTALRLVVNRDPNIQGQGIYNFPLTSAEASPLCSMKIKKE